MSISSRLAKEGLQHICLGARALDTGGVAGSGRWPYERNYNAVATGNKTKLPHELDARDHEDWLVYSLQEHSRKRS